MIISDAVANDAPAQSSDNNVGKEDRKVISDLMTVRGFAKIANWEEKDYQYSTLEYW